MDSPVIISIGALVGVVLIALILAGRATARRLEGLRARGVYPEPGKATEADVLRLVEAGEKILAIRCYREITGLGLKESKDAVEAMARKLRHR